jgi:hypothetical protein
MMVQRIRAEKKRLQRRRVSERPRGGTFESAHSGLISLTRVETM